MTTILPTDEAVENYKGQLIQYCQERGLGQPVYTETQHGPADSPSWHVTISYGGYTHETPEPVRGSKKLAHQVASKQVLEEIDSRRERFLGGDVKTEPTPAAEPTPTPKVAIEVPIDIVARAMTIANERLTASQPTRYRTLSDAEFSQKLARLTLQIVRELVEKARQDEIKLM